MTLWTGWLSGTADSSATTSWGLQLAQCWTLRSGVVYTAGGCWSKWRFMWNQITGLSGSYGHARTHTHTHTAFCGFLRVRECVQYKGVMHFLCHALLSYCHLHGAIERWRSAEANDIQHSAMTCGWTHSRLTRKTSFQRSQAEMNDSRRHQKSSSSSLFICSKNTLFCKYCTEHDGYLTRANVAHRKHRKAKKCKRNLHEKDTHTHEK